MIGNSRLQWSTYRTAWWGACPTRKSFWQVTGTSHADRRVTCPTGYERKRVWGGSPTRKDPASPRKWARRETGSKGRWTGSYLVCSRLVVLRSWNRQPTKKHKFAIVLPPPGGNYLGWGGAQLAAGKRPQSGIELVQLSQTVQMAEPRAVRVVLVGGWWGPLAVNQIERVPGERVRGVEDVAWPLAGLASAHALDVVSPSTVGVKRARFGHVVHYTQKMSIKVIFPLNCKFSKNVEIFFIKTLEVLLMKQIILKINKTQWKKIFLRHSV